MSTCVGVCMCVCQSQDDSSVSNGMPSYGTLNRPGVSSDIMSEMTLRLKQRRAKLESDASAMTSSVRSAVSYLIAGCELA